MKAESDGSVRVLGTARRYPRAYRRATQIWALRDIFSEPGMFNRGPRRSRVSPMQGGGTEEGQAALSQG